MGILPLRKKVVSPPTITQQIEEQKRIEIGLHFMKSEGVQVIPPTVKKIFLQKKGLKQDEI